MARQTMSFAKIEESTPAATTTQSRSAFGLAARTAIRLTVSAEATQPELCGDDHQTEQQRDRMCVDCEPGFFERQPAAGQNRDGAEQRDAAAIECETRNPSQDHPGIDQGKDGENQWVQAVRMLARISFYSAEARRATPRPCSTFSPNFRMNRFATAGS